ncbi:MAG TPA: hypothetical protein VI306_12770 [Pyrinomonadaceae bacterium]
MNDKQEKEHDEGWKPDAPSGEEALHTDERSLDIGGSGQFAPGGYYNQQGITQPHHTLDDIDDVVPPGRR